MKIQSVQKYMFGGVEFNSLKEVQDKVHDMIGATVIDQIEIRHKDLFTLLEILCSKEVRATLLTCYNVTYEEVTHDTENGGYQVEVKNILDLK